jgi:hypothetical protein
VNGREYARLVLTGKGHDGSGWASATEHLRAAMPIAPRSRSRCSCGCGHRATHVGVANGFAMMSGCDLRVRRWVRDPLSSLPSPASGGTS